MQKWRGAEIKVNGGGENKKKKKVSDVTSGFEERSVQCPMANDGENE